MVTSHVIVVLHRGRNLVDGGIYPAERKWELPHKWDELRAKYPRPGEYRIYEGLAESFADFFERYPYILGDVPNDPPIAAG